MTVGLLLVTHGKLGRHLLDTMTEMMSGTCRRNTTRWKCAA